LECHDTETTMLSCHVRNQLLGGMTPHHVRTETLTAHLQKHNKSQI